MDPWGGLLKWTVMSLFLLLKWAPPCYWGRSKALVIQCQLELLMHTHQLLGAVRGFVYEWHLMEPLQQPRFGQWMELRGHLHYFRR